MALVLIRCTTHREMSRTVFEEWLSRRRADLTVAGSGVRHLDAAPLGAATWILELHGAPGRDDDLVEAARNLLGDLALLGMRPQPFAPAPSISAGDVADDRLDGLDRGDPQPAGAAAGQIDGDLFAGRAAQDRLADR
jgi:hypothetical protein